jgi:hypothetical protein
LRLVFRITIDCIGVPPNVGPAAAVDIEQEFREHRRWWGEPRCTYADGSISLTASSEVDPDGLALLDEFGDCLSAYLRSHGAVRIRSVERIRASS